MLISSAAQTREKALPNYLSYASLIEPGIIVTKDGSLLAGVRYRGADMNTMTPDVLNAVSFEMNKKFMRLGSGWTIYVTATRSEAFEYPTPEDQYFPDTITQLIDNERRARFEKTGEHFETQYYLLVNYLPPLIAQTKLEQLSYRNPESESVADKVLHDFVNGFTELILDLGEVMDVEVMTEYKATLNNHEVARDQLLDFIHQCISGRNNEVVNISPDVMFLDSLLGRYDMVMGLEPILDNQHLRVIGLDAFPATTYPGVLAMLDSLPIAYRWSSRFIYVSEQAAKKEITKFRRKWQQKQRGLLDQLFHTNTDAVDGFASNMTAETEDALDIISSGDSAFGYFTSVIVVMDENLSVVREKAKQIISAIRRTGCTARLETINSMEAWLGSLPGHDYANIRRPLIHTMNLVDMLPLTSVWSGSRYNPCDLYPEKSPPLVLADTLGQNIFRLNLHVSDVGHTLIVGPTGAGKSTLLALLAAQFRKYAGSQVFCFDKGYSMYCLTKACGGGHFDIGNSDSGEDVVLSPLQELSSSDDHNWAAEWLDTCCQLQLNRALTPPEKTALLESVRVLSEYPPEQRNLSVLVGLLQNEELCAGLNAYTHNGRMGFLLDGAEDGLSLSTFSCFELDTLMKFGDADKLPVLLYLFRRIEKALSGKPAMIILDEAWLLLGHSTFREKIIEWLKVMRKNNAAVVMATQSISDAHKNNILDVISESTATKIFLPNPEAAAESSQPFYRALGLNEQQIELISRAKPKRDYYAVSVAGDSLFSFQLDEVALAILAQSGLQSKQNIGMFMDRHQDGWVEKWLQSHCRESSLSALGYKHNSGERT